MYHRERRKMKLFLISCLLTTAVCKSIESTTPVDPIADLENNIIDFDEDYSLKFNKRYGTIPWETNEKYNKEMHRYTVVKDKKVDVVSVDIHNDTKAEKIVEETTPENNYNVIPLELLSTTQDYLASIIDSTTEQDLTVIPLSTTKKVPVMEIKQTVTLPTSTQTAETTEFELNERLTEESDTGETTTIKRETTSHKNIEETTQLTTEVINTTATSKTVENKTRPTEIDHTESSAVSDKTNKDKFPKPVSANTTISKLKETTTNQSAKPIPANTTISNLKETIDDQSVKPDLANSTNSTLKETKGDESTKPSGKNSTADEPTKPARTNSTANLKPKEVLRVTSSRVTETTQDSSEIAEDAPSFSELDAVDQVEVPEDYYDNKDVLPTTAPKTDALSVIFGFAGSVVESVVESVAERVVPKSIFDLFKRMQKQNEALEAEKLRSREENGGLGQFGRGILKSISSGLSKPLSQLMQGVKDIGSLDTDRGFVSSVASGVTSVANVATSVADAFKDRVQAIYPGTVWCGDGHSATARSSDLGLFFFTDTCCRQHDACKIYIKAGETKYGLTNTGLFTRSHCSCDTKFRECLRKTNSLVSAQIGLTYFNVLGPQCFRKAHPIVKCMKRTRITGQKCEEYELDYTKAKMWQWFDNETF